MQRRGIAVTDQQFGLRRRLQRLQSLDDADRTIATAHAPHRARVTGVKRLAQLGQTARIGVGAQQVLAEQIRRHARDEPLALQERDAAFQLLLGATESRRNDVHHVPASE